jgi:hypothetical protein
MSFTTAARSLTAAALVAGAAAAMMPATASAAEARDSSASAVQLLAVHPMVSHARAYIGQSGGQCKAFVQRIHNEVYVSNLGAGYWDAYVNAGYHRISKAEVRAGDVIQETDAATHTRGIHTAIVSGNPDGPTIRVVDSNWVGYERVGEHTYDPTTHAQSKGGVAYYWRKG